jgi:hypothetical protein
MAKFRVTIQHDPYPIKVEADSEEAARRTALNELDADLYFRTKVIEVVRFPEPYTLEAAQTAGTKDGSRDIVEAVWKIHADACGKAAEGWGDDLKYAYFQAYMAAFRAGFVEKLDDSVATQDRHWYKGVLASEEDSKEDSKEDSEEDSKEDSEAAD